MATPDLEYVALVVQDVRASVTFFERDLGLPRGDARVGGRVVPIIAAGRSALAVFEEGAVFQEGDPFLGEHVGKGVHHIAIAADDPATTAKTTGFATRAVLTATPGLNECTQVELPRTRTCGVRTRLVEPLGLVRGRSPLVERIDHHPTNFGSGLLVHFVEPHR